MYRGKKNLTPYMINENQGCKMVCSIKIIQKILEYYEDKFWHLNSKYYYVNIFWMYLMRWNVLLVPRCSLVFCSFSLFFCLLLVIFWSLLVTFLLRARSFFARCLLLFTYCLTRNSEGFFLRKVNKKVLHINLQTKKLSCEELENWDSFKLEILSNLYGY